MKFYELSLDSKQSKKESGKSILVECPICNEPKNTSVRAIKRTMKKRGSWSCSSCFAKSPEGRKQRSEQAKKAWQNPETREKIVDSCSKQANSEQGKTQRSKQAKIAWENGEYRNKQEIRIKKQFQSEHHRKLVSENNKTEFLKDPEKYLNTKTSALRTKEAINNHKEAVNRIEYKNLHRNLALERFKDPNYKKKISLSLENFPRGGKKSKPEKVIESILEFSGIDFVYNKSVGPYNFDFYIPSSNTYIEVQGEYWHTLPNNSRRDKSKYTYLRLADPTSTIIYIWDYDLLSDAVRFKLSPVLGSFSYIQKDFEFSECKIQECSNSDAESFFNNWHYAQFGRKSKFVLSVSIFDEIIAMCKFSPVVRKEVATSMGGDTKSVFEIDRFCIHPVRQKKNFASWFISRACKIFFRKFPEVNKIISFADSTYGHDGIIYKASGWKEVGKVKPDYVYINEEGWIMHKKTLYNHAHSAHTSENEWAEKHGWNKVWGKEKTKFILER